MYIVDSFSAVLYDVPSFSYAKTFLAMLYSLMDNAADSSCDTIGTKI